MLKDYKQELKGVFFLIGGMLSSLAYFLPKLLGAFGLMLREALLLPLFNQATILFSGYLLLIGLGFIFQRRIRRFNIFLRAVSVFAFGSLMLWQLLAEGDLPYFAFRHQAAAGLPVYALNYLLQRLIGIAGLYLFISLSLFFTALMILSELGWFKLRTERVSVNVQPARKIDLRKIDQQLPRISTKKKLQPVEVKTFEERTSRVGNWQLPPLEILKLESARTESAKELQNEALERRHKLAETLRSFKIEAEVVNIAVGPSVMRFELRPTGTKVNKIANLADDLSLALSKKSAYRGSVPNKDVIGIEVPRNHSEIVTMGQLARNRRFYEDMLTVAIGLDIGGNPHYGNLEQMPHLLVAGATGSGKSVFINTLIISILLKSSPAEVKLLLIDPKRVELTPYNNIPHLIAPVINDAGLASYVLKNWALQEMEQRYALFAQVGVRNLKSFNEYAKKNRGRRIVINEKEFLIEPLPYLVLVIDELSDLMMTSSKEVEYAIVRLTQMARATGMHLVVATQRPSVDVITGLIKANIPFRLTFAVGSQVDSRTVIDVAGAEKLLGKGDMLYLPMGQRHLLRLQGVYLSDEEINRVTAFCKKQGQPVYEVDLDAIAREMKQKDTQHSSDLGGDDEMLAQALEILQQTDRRSISYLQRRLRIGYNRAARLMEEIEEKGLLRV